ncbi:NPCBM/NEW2 domain-containing protein [Antrihabitans stalactiti]|nr:NPCBM/NEW2 domain-containing protein [Antrihabitans stalactiti]
MGARLSCGAIGVTIVLVAALVGCGESSPDKAVTPQSTSSTSGSEVASGVVGDSGVTVSGVVDGVSVTATAPNGVADAGTQLSLSTVNSAADKPFTAAVATTPAIGLALGDGGQPKKPITVTFDLAKSDVAGKISDTVRPIVAVNSGTAEADLLEAEWDAKSKLVTTTTDHLSNFQIGLVDINTVLSDAAKQAWKALGSNNTDSACNGKPELQVAGATYKITASKPRIVTACLRQAGNGITVDMTSKSSQFYQVAPDPAGTFTNTQPLHGSDQLAAMLHASFAHGKTGLLTPNGGASIAFDASQTPRKISLDIDPAALQLETILTGIDMLGVSGDDLVDAFQNTKSAYDCLVTAYESWTKPGKGSPTELANALGDLAQCGLAGAQAAVGKLDTTRVLHKLSVATSLFTTLPKQLFANIDGIAAEFKGEQHLEFEIASSTSTSTGSPTTSATSSNTPTDTGPRWFTLDEIGSLSTGNGYDCCSTEIINNTSFPKSATGYYQTGDAPGDDNNHVNLLLAGKCDQLDVFIGQSAKSGSPTGPGRFRVYLNDTQLVSDQTIGINEEAIHLTIDLNGASRLKLRDDRHSTDAINVWGTPRLHCTTNPNPK